jgi:tetratricopeptide (TPR) repeat protein
VLILRIRRAETALADGRLDEAVELAGKPDFQAHRKGQQLIGQLVRSLAERGREHLNQGRLTQAAGDCEKAAALGGNLPEIGELRMAVTEAMLARQRNERRQAEVFAAAKAHVNDGRLSMGEQVLAEVDPDSTRARGLHEQLAIRRVTAEKAVLQAEEALRREDLSMAAQAIQKLRASQPENPRCAELTGRLTCAVAGRAGAAIDQGRLDLAESLLAALHPLGCEAIDTQELARFARQAREALESIARGELRAAVETLRRLAAIRPQAAWLATALQQSVAAAENLEALRGGPLGLLSAAASQPLAETIPLPPVIGDAPERRAGRENVHVPAGMLPARLVFHVDGAGSFLVLRDRRITIGPDGSSHRPEVALLAEPGMPPAVIERLDEDYFVECGAGVKVNDARTRRRLLVDGDSIALSSRCRIKYTRPHAASTTAVLQLSGTRLPKCDARRIILLDREIIIGPGSAAHVRCDALPEPAMLHVRDGRMMCRTNQEVLVDGRPMDRHAGIPLGASVQVGAVSFVVTAG